MQDCEEWVGRPKFRRLRSLHQIEACVIWGGRFKGGFFPADWQYLVSKSLPEAVSRFVGKGPTEDP
jgi:hypothetical protein